jgi:hypothetical protein
LREVEWTELARWRQVLAEVEEPMILRRAEDVVVDAVAGGGAGGMPSARRETRASCHAAPGGERGAGQRSS